MRAETALEARGLTRYFGAIAATDGFDLALRPGELHALIGPNGAGKTTAVNQLAGELRPDSGHILLHGRDVTRHSADRRARSGLARSFQVSSLFEEFTALANVMLAVQAHQGHSFRFLGNAAEDRRLREPALALLERTGLGQRDEVPAAILSHGERRRLELAMALAGEPTVLLLDEPMSGAGPEAVEEMIALLGSLKGDAAVLLVEHDMDAVFNLADRITVMVQGQVIACGTVDEVRGDSNVQAAYLGREGTGAD